MADSAAFEWICEELIERTDLDRLEARGTVRIALKSSGLEARSVTPTQLGVVLEKVLPRELEARDVERADELCRKLLARLAGAGLEETSAGDSPDEVFRRLGRS